MADHLILTFNGIETDVLTGIYSEETHLPQPLRISIRAELRAEPHYAPGDHLAKSKSYMDLKHAATDAIPKDVHFTLIESVAEHIIASIFMQDDKVLNVEVTIAKLAIATGAEEIGITLRRERP